jgi:aminoglycoside 3'-phosphotransferase-2
VIPDGYTAVRQTIGKSGNDVDRLEAPGRPTLFLKSGCQHPLSEIPDEIARLRWLGAKGIPCPEVLRTGSADGGDWLLMSALPGRDLAVSFELGPEHCLTVMADALRRLHAIDIASCPFDHRLVHRVARARQHLDAGLVDESDFDSDRLGRTAQSEYAELLATLPTSEDLVVTHGDASFPNVLTDGERFTGFVDVGRLGVADRWQDLALAWRSAESNFAAGAGDLFLSLYSVRRDDTKLRFFRLLDEFF